MDLEHMRARNDYRFRLNGLEEGSTLLEDLRKGSMDILADRGEPYIGAAILETGYLDVELNIFSKAQVSTLPEEKDDQSAVLLYFVCVRDEHGDWINDGYLDTRVQVDWKAPDWKEQLERDMFEALDTYAGEKGYSHNSPNRPAGVLADFRIHL